MLQDAITNRDKELANRIEEVDDIVNLITVAGRGYGLNVVTDPGFELDNGTWSFTTGDGTVDIVETDKYAGKRSLRVDYGGAASANARQAISVVAANVYSVQFWTRGDGTNQGLWMVWDTAAGPIVSQRTTGVTAATWTLVTHSFTMLAGGGTTYLIFYSPSTAGYAYFDDITVMDAITYATLDEVVGQLWRAMRQILGDW